MPSRIPRPCRKAGCSGTTTDRQGYCEQHKASNWKGWQERKGSDTQRGYGWAWRKLRKQILERDSYLCQECLRVGTLREGRVVDHIKPKAQGGTDATDNLQTLCKSHHDHKTATERRGGAGLKSMA